MHSKKSRPALKPVRIRTKDRQRAMVYVVNRNVITRLLNKDRKIRRKQMIQQDTWHTHPPCLARRRAGRRRRNFFLLNLSIGDTGSIPTVT